MRHRVVKPRTGVLPLTFTGKLMGKRAYALGFIIGIQGNKRPEMAQGFRLFLTM
jgi:hypothetical protein